MAGISPALKTRTYTIRGLVGEGGYGRVYRAQLSEGEYTKDVAIKILREANPDADLLARFRDEARILSLFRDRAVVSMDPPVQLGGHWAVVMDFVDGMSLRQIVNKIGRMPAPVALEVVAEIARAVDKAYTFPGPDGEPIRLLHRDIKPANIHLTPSGEVRLLDFGTARADFDTREAHTVADISGTPGYLAPERLEGTEGPAGDVFSLGVTLWAMLTKEGPMVRRQDELEAGIEEWAQQDPDVGLALQLAFRMRERDPGSRPSLAEVKSAAIGASRMMKGPHLEDWCSQIPHQAMAEDDMSGRTLTETIVSGTGHPAPVRSSGRGLMFASVGAGLIGVATVAAVLLVLIGAAGMYASRGPATTDSTTVFESSPLTLTSRPPGATVWLDGEELGRTPIHDHPIALGEYEIRMKKGMFATHGVLHVDSTAPRSHFWNVMLAANGVEPPFETGRSVRIVVRSSPPGARVSVGEELVGEAPLTLQLSPGSHRVSLRKGQFEVDAEIEVGEGTPTSYSWDVIAGTEGFAPAP